MYWIEAPISWAIWALKAAIRRSLAYMVSPELTIVSAVSAKSTFDDVDGQPAARGFFVFGLHVGAGFAHGLDHPVERHFMRTVAALGQARGVDRLDRAHGVPLDAGDLHQTADRIAGEPKIVLHADLGGVFDLNRRPAERGDQTGRGHRAGDAHLSLAADLGAGDRGVL